MSFPKLKKYNNRILNISQNKFLTLSIENIKLIQLKETESQTKETNQNLET